MKIIVTPNNERATVALAAPETLRMKVERATMAQLIKRATGITLASAYSERIENHNLVVEITDRRLLSMLPAAHIVKSIEERMRLHKLEPIIDYNVEVRS